MLKDSKTLNSETIQNPTDSDAFYRKKVNAAFYTTQNERTTKTNKLELLPTHLTGRKSTVTRHCQLIETIEAVVFTVTFIFTILYKTGNSCFYNWKMYYVDL